MPMLETGEIYKIDIVIYRGGIDAGGECQI